MRPQVLLRKHELCHLCRGEQPTHSYRGSGGTQGPTETDSDDDRQRANGKQTSPCCHPLEIRRVVADVDVGAVIVRINIEDDAAASFNGHRDATRSRNGL